MTSSKLIAIAIVVVLSLASGGGAGILPTDVAGLGLWLRADQVSTSGPNPAVGSSIGTWDNSNTVTGGSAVQADAARQPTLQVANFGIFSMPVLRFDGTTDAMEYTTGFTVRTYFFVYNFTGGTTPDGTNFTGYPELFASRSPTYVRFQGNKDWGGMQMVNMNIGDARLTDANHFDSSVPLLGTLPNTAFTTGGNPLSQFRIISLTQASPDWADSAAYSWGSGAYIGAINFGSGLSNFWQGDIAEIITYSGRLSDADRQGIELYLEKKYIVPEPSTVLLLGCGALWLGRARRRRG